MGKCPIYPVDKLFLSRTPLLVPRVRMPVTYGCLSLPWLNVKGFTLILKSGPGILCQFFYLQEFQFTAAIPIMGCCHPEGAVDTAASCPRNATRIQCVWIKVIFSNYVTKCPDTGP